MSDERISLSLSLKIFLLVSLILGKQNNGLGVQFMFNKSKIVTSCAFANNFRLEKLTREK